MRLLKEECAIFLVFFMLSTVAKTTGKCVIKKDLIANELRLILKYEDDDFQLVRENKIQNGSKFYMVCNDFDITELSCENGKFRPELPLPACSNVSQVQLKLENNSQLCPYNLYSVGYQVLLPHGHQFLETYKVCFEYAMKRPVFTIHEVYPFVGADRYVMQMLSDEIFASDEIAAYNMPQTYEQFQAILGNGQTFMASNATDERIDRGYLTPVRDFMTKSLMATTFKMVNVIPQFQTIKNGNWKIIQEWARNRENTPAKVCSGVLRWTLQLPDVNNTIRDMYLGTSIPIPLWTYKIVLSSIGIRTVFLQNNNIYDKHVPPSIPDGTCQETSCPSNIYLVMSNYYGYTYCCNPDHFMTNNVPNLKGYC